jgi:hypothetical protein
VSDRTPFTPGGRKTFTWEALGESEWNAMDENGNGWLKKKDVMRILGHLPSEHGHHRSERHRKKDIKKLVIASEP